MEEADEDSDSDAEPIGNYIPEHTPNHEYITADHSPCLYSTHNRVSYSAYVQSEAQESTNTFLWLLLLAVKASANGTNSNMSFMNGRQHPKAGVHGKQQKAGKGSVSFRQMFTFADLASKGTTIYVFESTKEDAALMWKYTQPRVGDVCAMLEPNKEEKKLGELMYIAQSK